MFGSKHFLPFLLLFISAPLLFPAPPEPRTIPATTTAADLRRSFEHPPDDARIMMRWWWFGPAVTKPRLEAEMRMMKAGGIGGFEVQPVYPLWLDDPEHGVKNLPYLSDGFIDALRFTGAKARELGLRIDVTLGSGWPFGGPHIPVTQAAGRLRCDRVPVPPGARSLPLPDMTGGESLLAVFMAAGDARGFKSEGLRRLGEIENGQVRIPPNRTGDNVVLFFIASRTGQQVKRAAVNAEGFVLDHMDRAAAENHLKTVGDRLMQAFTGAEPPTAVFSDSLEVFGSDWTGDLLNEFRKRRGYDLLPYLPALVGDIGERTAAIRYDWGQTLIELTEERYLTPMTAWAHRHNTRFRSQTYGAPPVTLSSCSLVDLAEGEGPRWRGFSSTRWASSANHLYGRTITSSETWTWLHSPSFRATPLDMKAEADLHLLQGVNQLVGHGWPYSPEVAGRPGWRFYAAAVFNDHNPWWIVMPDLTRYLQRVSYLMRQGKPANDIAVYLPTADALAQFTAGRASVDRAMSGLLGTELIPQILDAGYNFDFIDDRAIEKLGIAYKAVILPGVEYISPPVYQKIAEYAQSGGIVIATRRMPTRAPGLMNEEQNTVTVRTVTGALFESTPPKARLVDDEKTLGAVLAKAVQPDLATGMPDVGFIHRKLADAHVYFIANTSNAPVHGKGIVRVTGLDPEWWDPFSGKTSRAAHNEGSNGTTVDVDLQPYESRVLVFVRTAKREAGSAGAPPPLDAVAGNPASGAAAEGESGTDLSGGWKVTFTGLNRTVDFDKPRSWTEDDETRFYSGEAVYEKTLLLPLANPKPQSRLVLNFGKGTPIEPAQGDKPGMRAWLEAPVREAAVVSVNGQVAGYVWRPPYEIDVTRVLRPGENHIRITVANTAINALAGQSPPSYRLLKLRYTERFTPQDMDNLKPLPSGLLEAVRLEVR
jgi:hypothetical protein